MRKKLAKRYSPKATASDSSRRHQRVTSTGHKGFANHGYGKVTKEERTSTLLGHTKYSRDHTSVLFPPGSIWLVHVITMCVRLRVVCNSDSWWILHPDEVYQGMEVAHAEVYGYGFRPYEYLRATDGDTAAQKQERDLGMYSLRPFLYPRIYMTWLRLVTVLGIEVSPFQACRVLHCAVSSHLPLAVYLFVRQVAPRSEGNAVVRDLAILCAILVAVSEHLSVLGTHSLLNSFLGPVVFVSLAGLSRTIGQTVLSDRPSEGEDSPGYYTYCAKHKLTMRERCDVSEIQECKNTKSVTRQSNTSELTGLSVRNLSEDIQGLREHTNASQNSECHSRTCHFSQPSEEKNYKTAGKKPLMEWIEKVNMYNNPTKRNVPDENGNLSEDRASSSQYLYSASCILSQNQLELDHGMGNANKSVRVRTNHYKNAIIGRKGDMNLPLNLPQTNFGCSSCLSVMLLGFVTGLLCYVRLDLILFYAVMIPTVLYTCGLNLSSSARWCSVLGAGVSGGLLLGGLDDRYSYGTWFLTPVRWFSFNVLSGHAALLFGWQEASYYLSAVILHSTTTTAMAVFTMLVTFYFLLVRGEKVRRLYMLQRLFSLTCVVMLIFYSFQKHKEVRFVHNAIVLFHVCFAMSMYLVLQHGRQYLRDSSCVPKRVTYVMLTTLIVHAYMVFPSGSDGSARPWTYQHVSDSGSIQRCVAHVAQATDVRGVFLDRSLHHTGGYSLLHHDVPLITRLHLDFYEFGVEAREQLPPVDLLSQQQFVNVSVLRRVSNFFTLENFRYLFKYLVLSPQYNYYIIRKNRKVSNIGFREVFSSGTMKVIKRVTFENENEALLRSVASIPVGTNATVLEYEGSWLMTFGLYQEGTARLHAAIRADPHRVRPYQLLVLYYRHQQEHKLMMQMLDACYAHNDRSVCSNLQPRAVLHPELTLYPATPS